MPQKSSLSAFAGDWLTPSDPGFKEAIYGGTWNELRPSRLPEIVARVTCDEDVIFAVNYAREHGIKAVVRGGGHNWCCPSLRDGSLMIDLSRLTGIVSIDAENRRAVVHPIISNRDLLRTLTPYELAYPSGHCPEVKMSGYLLSGGMSWNHGVWGPGVGSIEAIEMVTADGKLVTASRDENAELFWAARGAGPGFFAVALRYHLRLYHRPRAIACSSYHFPVENVIKIAEWLGPLADELEPKVELSLFMVAAPDSVAKQFDLHGGKVCMVTATVFADTPEEAESALRPLEGCPYMGNCLSRSFAKPSAFEQLFDASGALWPAKLRAKVDAMLSNAKLSNVVASVADHYVECPSKETVLMYAIYTGGSAPATPPDAAFSMTGKLYGGPWTMWRNPGEDASNIAWHARCVELLLPLMHGHYISESDTAGHPEYVKSSFLGDSLARIEELRRKYDPKGVFVGFHEGI